MQPRIIKIRKKILEKNDHLAQQLRGRFERHRVFVANFVSSPGSGKTELLARTLAALNVDYRPAAVVGDLATENDAKRLASSGAPTKQILTGTMCHLEADMVQNAIGEWDLDALDFLLIENVGNLVCPSNWDLGEDLRVLLLSTTEGEDKPLKYPTLVNTADVVIISKLDLAGVVEFDLALAKRNVLKIRPGIDVLSLSAKTGEGVAAWLDYLTQRFKQKYTTQPN